MQNKTIEKLRRLAERAESRGQYNTAHHQMLANYLAAQQPEAGLTPQNAETGDMEEPDNGKQNL